MMVLLRTAIACVIGCSVPHPAGKMYIQDKVEEYADEVFDLLVGPSRTANMASDLGTCRCRGRHRI